MNLRPFIAAVAAAAVLAGGALASATVSLLAPAEDDAIELVPRNAVLYGNIFLDPSTPQKVALQDLLERFPEMSTPEDARAAVVRVLDQGLAEIGLNFETDVEPWLGKQLAMYLLPPTFGASTPSGAVLIATEDAGATQATLDKVADAKGELGLSGTDYKGVDHLVSGDGTTAVGIVDDFLVLSDTIGFHATVDTAGGADSLEESDEYEDSVDDLTEDRLALLFTDFSQMLGALPPDALPPGMLQGPFAAALQPSVAIAFARSDALVFEQSTALPDDPSARALAVGAAEGTDLLERVPGDAWGTFGVPDLGNTLRSLLDAMSGMGLPGVSSQMLTEQFRAQTGLDLEGDLLSWMDDVAFFISGAELDRLGGGAIIASSDPARSAASLPKIARALRAANVEIEPLGFGPNFEGFAIRPPGAPDRIYVIAADERVLIVYGKGAASAALGSDPALGGTEGFATAQSALGEGFNVAGYVDLQAPIALIESIAGATDPTYENDVKPFLEHLSFAVFGSRIDGDRSIARIVLGAR